MRLLHPIVATAVNFMKPQDQKVLPAGTLARRLRVVPPTATARYQFQASQDGGRTWWVHESATAPTIDTSLPPDVHEWVLYWLGSLTPKTSVADADENDAGDAYTLGQLRGFAVAYNLTLEELLRECDVSPNMLADEACRAVEEAAR